MGVLNPRGVSAQGRSAGGCLPGGCLPKGGMSAWGEYLPRYSPPVDRMTHTCKNITFPQTLFAGGNKNNNHINGNTYNPYKFTRNPNAAMHTVSIMLFELVHLHFATTTQTFDDVSIIFYDNAWLPMFAIMIEKNASLSSSINETLTLPGMVSWKILVIW